MKHWSRIVVGLVGCVAVILHEILFSQSGFFQPEMLIFFRVLEVCVFAGSLMIVIRGFKGP